jgi:hypothetical protein
MSNTVPHGYESDSSSSNTTIHARGNPDVPYKASVFDVTHDRGLRTAYIAGKTSMTICSVSYDGKNGAPDLVPPDDGRNKIDFVLYTGESPFVVDAFLPSFTNGNAFHYAFLHFSDLDHSGHVDGWGTSPWFDALQEVDAQLQRIFAAIETSTDQGKAARTAIILTADHGGFEYGHTRIPPLDYHYTIPLMVWGPAFQPGADLYSLFANRADPGTNWVDYNAIWQPLRNGDTGNLALALLGLPPIPGSTLIPLFHAVTTPLAIAHGGNVLSVEWPASVTGFTLETTDALGPGAVWTPVTSGIVTNVNGFRYEAPAPVSPQFFRLRK